MWEIAKTIFFTSGFGQGDTPLNAFDRALMDAQIANYNHIKVSSIIPVGASIVESKSSNMPVEGCLLPSVWSESLGQTGDTISASLCLALNKNKDLCGMIFEYSHISLPGNTYPDPKEEVEKMVKTGMADRKWEILTLLTKVQTRMVTEKHGCCIVVAAYIQ